MRGDHPVAAVAGREKDRWGILEELRQAGVWVMGEDRIAM